MTSPATDEPQDDGRDGDVTPDNAQEPEPEPDE